jgi:glyoxylase-like metal-dependent hydrolase (beta-lactamase superfamily II)
MFGLIPRTMWEKWIKPDALNRIGLAMNCVLLERDQADGTVRRTLIETGAGGKWDAKAVAEYEFACQPDGKVRTVEHALAEVGVARESIADVVVTHLHFDHAGGLTRVSAEGGGGVSPSIAFPNARIHVQRQEWEDALANRSTMTRTYLRTHLDPIADRVVLHEGESEILPGLRVLPLVGHTWGQQGVCWDDEHGTLCFPGDLLPTVHHSHPAASLGYDMLPYETMLTKRSLLARAQAKQWRLVLDHEPGPCVMRAKDGRLVPEA